MKHKTSATAASNNGASHLASQSLPQSPPPLFASFRQAMAWVHTWLGLTLGAVLMVCFFFGTLSVFDREIDRWAIPTTRFEAQPMPSFDKVLLPAFEAMLADPAEYAANMPDLHDPKAGSMTPREQLIHDEYWAYTTHRDPVLRMGAGFSLPHPKDASAHNHIHGEITLDPRSGQPMPSGAFKIGSNWFFPMHYNLNWTWMGAGYWLVGLAGVVMLVALISGLVLHRKVFREFFTFRPSKHMQRSTLDLHNMTGVLALPFHLFFAFTGVLIFAGWLYFPASQTLLKPLHDRHEVQEAAAKNLPHERAGVPATLASVDAMVAEAKRRWAARGMAGEVGFLTVHHVGDANAYVTLYRAGSDQVALVGQAIYFEGTTGKVLHEAPPPSAIAGTFEFLTGLHLQHFRHWLLRWLYVLGGLMGCVCIATGMIFFVEKRKKQHAKTGQSGAVVVDALAIALVTGPLIAALAMLVANRLIPVDWPLKAEGEKATFWVAWALSALHAAWRARAQLHAQTSTASPKLNPAWTEQCWSVAALALTAALLNWLTTGDHLLRTVFTHTYWPVAGVDLSLLATAGIATLAAQHLSRVASTKPQHHDKS